jgi:membrane associated rhomboid family serine protease
MPRCVECETETPREEMFGAPGDLRCRQCVGKRRVSLTSLPKEREVDNAPIWTFMLVLMAVIVYAGEQLPGAEGVRFLWDEPTRIWDGELWRLLTTALPHGGLLHLFFNCYALAMLGTVTERAIGSNRYLGLIVLLALGASATQFLVQPNPSVGLSGVVYGLFGFLFALRLYKDYARVVMTDSIMKQFIGWFVLCWILTYASNWRIANFAHAGGLAVGWLVGKSMLKRRTELRIAGIAVVVMLLSAMTMYMPWSAAYRHYQANKDMIRAINDVQVPAHLDLRNAAEG